MNTNSTITERMALIGRVAPQSINGASVDTGLVPIKLFRRLLAVINVGAITATGVVTAKLQAAVGDAGSPVDIPGAAITALTAAGTDSNKVAMINFNIDKLAGDDYTHVKLVITDATAAALVAGELWGGDALYAPASDNDNTVVDEIVTV